MKIHITEEATKVLCNFKQANYANEEEDEYEERGQTIPCHNQ
jgi:hypothetical protein